MSDDNFVSRWSRLKREAARKPPVDAEAADSRPGPEKKESGTEASSEARKPEPELDLASLPPIDSIVAGSDIRAFLQKGVPADLTKAALRRAWTSDPAIRDFIGLAENQWDFTDPTAIPGFGVLKASDNIGQLVAQAMGKLEDVPDAIGLSQEPPKRLGAGHEAPDLVQSPGAPERQRSDAAEQAVKVEQDVEVEQALEVAQPVAIEQTAEGVAAQHHEHAREDSAVTLSRRGHGRALPK